MKQRYALLILLLSIHVLTGYGNNSRASQKVYEERDSTVSSRVNDLIGIPDEIADLIYSKTKDFPEQTQLAIAMVNGDQVSYYGTVNDQGTLIATDNRDRIFEIGSITKLFTSVLLSSLAAEGKIDPEEDINHYYPFPFHGERSITFASLASHTSGLPRLPANLVLTDLTNPYKHYGKEELEAYLQEMLTFDQEAGVKYSYSNLGAGLLGHTLSLSQQTGFDLLLQQRVFEPYGMNSSYVGTVENDERLVAGRDMTGEITPNWDFDVLAGAGAVRSSVTDLARFAIAQFNSSDKVLALTRIPRFKVDEHMQMGLGWHILTDEMGKRLYWHNGGTGGYSSSFMLQPEQKRAVIILSNVSAFHPETGTIEQLCVELIRNLNQPRKGEQP